MVAQGEKAIELYYGDNNTNVDGHPEMDLMAKWFVNEVRWFAIYSCTLGVVMLIGTYLSIMLFNFAAHSQVSFIYES